MSRILREVGAMGESGPVPVAGTDHDDAWLGEIDATMRALTAHGHAPPFHLNLGAGNVRLREGYVTLDRNPAMAPDIPASVPPIPLPDESCGTVYASHFLEHLSDATVCRLLGEVWRVLVPGGTFAMVSPYAFSHGAIQDPTHRSLWVPEKLLYFTGHFAGLGYDLEQRFSVVALGLDAAGQYERSVRATLRKERAIIPCHCPFCEAER